MKKVLSLALSFGMLLALAACQGAPALIEEGGGKATNEAAAVYFLNPDPALDAQWQELAALYTQQTGVPVTVATPEEGGYEAALASEMPKIEAPTLFAVSGAQSNWAEYGWDLAGSEVYAELSMTGLAAQRNETVLAVPYDMRAYGLLVNASILERMESSIGDVESFSGLKFIAESIAGRRETLEFGAFAASGLSESEEPGTGAMLANVALWLDKQDGASGKYLEHFKAAWDLVMNSSTCVASELAGKTPANGLQEFCEEKAAFYLTGDWDYEAVRAALPEAELVVLPVCIGAGDEERRGLCAGAQGYWCVNREADLNDIEATLDFMKWCVSSPEGVAALEGMGFNLPYKAAPTSTNPFISQALHADGRELVPWIFASAPEGWESELNAALAAYAAGGSWDAVAAVYAGA